MINKQILLFIFLPLVIFGQEFSIESYVNRGHVILYEQYDAIREYCSQRDSVERSHFPKRSRHLEEINFIIPDSLTNSVFKFDIGDSVTQILNGKIVGHDNISSFEFDSRMQAGSNERIYFKLSNLPNIHENWWDIQSGENARDYYENYFLYVISNKTVTTFSSTPFVDCPPEEINLNQIYSFIIENESNDEIKSSVFVKKIDNEIHTINYDSLKTNFSNYCSYQKQYIYRNDNSEFSIIKVSCNQFKYSGYWNFSFVLSNESDLLYILPCSDFELCFEIKDDIYFVFRRFTPNTGIRGRIIYHLDIANKSLVPVFSEFSWST